MKKIVIFGNCQGGQLRRILSALLPATCPEFAISFISNNSRTGGKKSNQEIISSIRDCDALIYQPLSSSHGDLGEENIKKTTRRDCVQISWPYIFNSGVCSLCHAPRAIVHSYGKIFGEEIIISQIKAGKNKQEIISDYKSGNIDFNVMKRFRESLAVMKSRESSTDIKLTAFIEQKYKDAKLFITHNHPSNILLYEIIRQIMNILPLPIDPIAIDKLSLPDLPETNCPLTPYDVEIHGYTFNEDKDWMTKGASLIELINNDFVGQPHKKHERST